MSAPSNLNSNINVATSALDAHLSRVRSSVPPSVGAACFPDSTSTLLRNIILAMGALNAFLLMGSIFASGARFMGFNIVLISMASCAHVACVAMVMGGHVADSASSIGFDRSAATLRGTATRYGTDAVAHGALLGSTVVMALVMHVASSFYGEASRCVGDLSVRGGAHNLTGGYADENAFDNVKFDPYSACGSSASAPLGFVSFVSGLLFWLNVALTGILYAKRGELLSGVVGPSNQYDEIGRDDEDGRGFAGDFPPQSTGMRTMHV